MKLNLRKMIVMMVVAAQLVPAIAISAIPRSDRDVSQGLDEMDQGVEVDFMKVQPVYSLREWKKEDIAKVIPTDLKESSSQGTVASQILDHSLSNFMKSEAVRQSDLGRTATTVENAMAQDISIGGEEEGTTKHVFKFRMEPTQTKAQLYYTGLLKARASYHMVREQLDVEVYEKVAADTDVVLSHTDKKDDRREMLSLRLTW